jgi:hypothetical protein
LVFKKIEGYFGDNCNKSVYEINTDSGIIDNTYKKIWEHLCEILESAGSV